MKINMHEAKSQLSRLAELAWQGERVIIAKAPRMVDEIRQATNGNFALGNDRFKEEIEAALGRRVQPGRPGRPKKKGAGKSKIVV